MNKTILFPFNFAKDNKKLFCKALSFAESRGDQLICFTAVVDVDKLDAAYLHLLDLSGYYQTLKNNWGKSLPEIKKEIRVGVFVQELFHFLSSNNFDLIIADQENMVLAREFLHKLIQNNVQKPEIITFNFEDDYVKSDFQKLNSILLEDFDSILSEAQNHIDKLKNHSDSATTGKD